MITQKTPSNLALECRWITIEQVGSSCNISNFYLGRFRIDCLLGYQISSLFFRNFPQALQKNSGIYLQFESYFNYDARKKVSSLSTACRPPLGSIRPAVQWVTTNWRATPSSHFVTVPINHTDVRRCGVRDTDI